MSQADSLLSIKFGPWGQETLPLVDDLRALVLDILSEGEESPIRDAALIICEVLVENRQLVFLVPSQGFISMLRFNDALETSIKKAITEGRFEEFGVDSMAVRLGSVPARIRLHQQAVREERLEGTPKEVGAAVEQLPLFPQSLGLKVDPRLCFKTFVKTNDNSLALEAARALVSGKLEMNGLLILGVPGSGKTHLAQAIVHECLRVDSSFKVVAYDLASSWGDALVDTLRPGAPDGASRRFKKPFLGEQVLLVLENVGKLLLDGNKKATLKHLRSIIDSVVAKGGKVVLTSSRPVSVVEGFLGGKGLMLVSLGNVDGKAYEVLKAWSLRKKWSERPGAKLPEGMLRLIARFSQGRIPREIIAVAETISIGINNGGSADPHGVFQKTLADRGWSVKPTPALVEDWVGRETDLLAYILYKHFGFGYKKIAARLSLEAHFPVMGSVSKVWASVGVEGSPTQAAYNRACKIFGF